MKLTELDILKIYENRNRDELIQLMGIEFTESGGKIYRFAVLASRHSRGAMANAALEAGRVYQRWTDLDLADLKRIRHKNIPLYVGWPYKSKQFDKLLQEG